MEKINETVARIKRWAKGAEDEGRQQLVVRLDRDSVERLRRLRGKIRTLDDDALIARGLECLEHKADRIIKRQISKKSARFNMRAEK